MESNAGIETIDPLDSVQQAGSSTNSNATGLETEPHQPEQTRVEGLIESLTRWGATGWAWIPESPDEALRIEAVLSGRIIGWDVADRMRPDLAKRGKRFGRCSFSLTFEGELDNDAIPVIHAINRDNVNILSGSKWTSVAGYVDRISRSEAIGWAWMPSAPGIALEVEAILDGRVIGRAVANEMRPDIASSGRGSGLYGFSLRFEEPIDGLEMLSLRILGPGDPTILQCPDQLALDSPTDPNLPDSNPKTLTAESGTPAILFEGIVENATSRSLSGWAWMPSLPNKPAQIDAYLDGTVIGSAIANQFRPDLSQCGKGTGSYGFIVTFSKELTQAAIPIVLVSGPHGSEKLPIADWLMVELEPHGMKSDDTKATETLLEFDRSINDSGLATENEDLQKEAFELDLIVRSGLFDPQYYLSRYPDIAEAGVPALKHFYKYGYLEGRQPNFYFDPNWYLEKNPDVLKAKAHPLVHYVLSGDTEGRMPSLLFDPKWFRKTYLNEHGDIALSLYLKDRKNCQLAPIEEFDISHYARLYPDVVAAGIDPFEHFITFGYREGRTPSESFDANFYWARYLNNDRDAHPYLHFLAHKHLPGIYGRMPAHETSVPREIKRNTKPAAEFEEFMPLPESAPRQAKLLAYYLPQFHAFPENNAWWGNGFTEWTNITRGVPRFKGHYQPRVPRDLGFYSLENSETMRRQVAMAKAGGIFGFVFYYYWFNGKRLLQKPIETFLADQSIEMPFCLMWANENWTRRWDGADAEILISQDYRLEDEVNLLADFARHFRDPRYIRLEGRPVLMIYRPGLIDDAKNTIARWREIFRGQFNENPILIMGQTFRATDPSLYSMDGAIEFPPHKLTQDMSPINSTLQYLDLEFEGKAYRYDDVVETSLNEVASTFPLIKTVVPSWDNDSRRQGNGLVIVESTPLKYQAWLSELVERAVKKPFYGESIICVNAWNEWCEGAYLEPDLHYGSAYLNATARAVAGKSLENKEGRILLVGHDCFPSGAQQLLLTIGRTLKSYFGVEPTFVLLDGGKLEAAYREVGPLRIGPPSEELEAHLWSLKESGYTAAIVNTSAAAVAVPLLKKAGIEVTILVHELPRILREKGLMEVARIAIQQADKIIFPAPFVRDQYCLGLDHEPRENMSILPQGMYQRIEISSELREARRSEFGISAAERLVIGMGYADMRKGFDLFLQVWRLTRHSSPMRVHFCWVGGIDPGLKNMMRDEILDAEQTGTFHMPGYRNDVSSFLAAADAFVLSSREDPFPSVVLEALFATLPVMAFEKSGGMPDVLRDHPLGHVVPFADALAMADTLIATLQNGPSDDARASGPRLIETNFNFPAYVWKLLKLSNADLPSISVAVPNYNYAAHMPKRLGGIFLQTQPIKEILVLDDCSKDNSLDVISKVAKDWNRKITVLTNENNSGSVFKQWRKAAENSTGDFLWIAEADDLCAPKYLSQMLALMKHDSTVQFAFSDSNSIDADDKPIWPSYKPYYGTVEPGALSRTEIFDGKDFAVRFLSVKNIILNVSAVVWRRKALITAINACGAKLEKLKMAGDWLLYLQTLSIPNTKIAYCSEPLNTHRRHAASVTHALDADRHVTEIADCHHFAATAFSLGGPCLDAQTKYLSEVKLQLTPPAKSSHKHFSAR